MAEYRELSTLRNWSDNPRSIKQDRFDELKKRLSEFGEIKPLIVTDDGEVLGGNMRLRAMKELGFKKAWVSIVHPKTEADKVKIALTDNEEMGYYEDAALAELIEKYKADIDLTKYSVHLGDPINLDELLAKFGPEPEEDEVPEVSDEPAVSVLGEVYQLGRHRVMCGDSTKIEDVENLMDGKKADMVFTSPPYNQQLDTFKPSGMQKDNPNWVKKMGSAYGDSKPEEEYQTMQIDLLNTLYDITTDNACLFYNHKNRYRDKQTISPLLWVTKSMWKLRQEVVWNRGGSITLNARMFIPCDERIYWMFKGDDFTFNDEYKNYSTVWDIAPINEIKNASAPFPNELPVRGIKSCSSDGDVVLDPYCGTGTTLIACEQTNRTCYGMELDPRYVDVCRRRYWKFTHDNDETGWEEGTLKI